MWPDKPVRQARESSEEFVSLEHSCHAQEKFNLNFTLLADTEKEVIKLYDVWQEKNMYGKITMGVVRTTYLINENGIITKAFGKVKAAENPADMLKEVRK